MNTFIFTVIFLYFVIMMILISLNTKNDNKKSIYNVTALIIILSLIITSLTYALLNTPIMAT